ncbi:MAG TPA: WYL domain-containing protein [Gemmatimonadales bacterium]|nr:WYL domain-containing protein [Gemmatimonadales bacterium]
MPDQAIEQFQRLLRLLPLLADGKAHDYAEIARKGGVSVADVIADLRTIAHRDDGPGGFVESLRIELGHSGAALTTTPFRRPMRLTGRELAALELGLALVETETPPEERAVPDRARKRLRDAILRLPTADGLGPTAAEPGPELDLALLSELRKAVQELRVSRITYQGSGRKGVEERTVCPYAVLWNAGMWYLVAHCREVSGLRIFRLDRITKHKVTASRFTVPAEFSLDAVLRDGRMFVARDAVTLRVRYSPRIARWIAERVSRPLERDGSLVLEHPMADPEWAVRHVLQYGPDAEVLAPESVREEVVRRVRKMGA